MEHCVKILNNYRVSSHGSSDLSTDLFHHINAKLCAYLNEWKNNIQWNGYWNFAKKVINEYELIFTRSGKKKPISRAYYKLWEISHDFELLRHIIHSSDDSSSCSIHLAEGPGGFIESLCDMCVKHNVDTKKHFIHGITLLSRIESVPNWKINDKYFKNFNIRLHDSTNGDLYQLTNLDTFVNEFHGKKGDLITADGGFDFSEDFNTQELQFHKLMLSQIFLAITLQKRGGSFLLKVFDLFLPNTIILLTICSLFYRSFTIIKPKTSRPANSEKYILFEDFDHELSPIPSSELLPQLRHCIQSACFMKLDYIRNSRFYKHVLEHVTMYNIVYSFNQMLCLKKTIMLTKQNKEMHEKMLLNNTLKCIQWRTDYDLVA
jgi:23S rRNA U2552 (ribose-2'-O)-methylase RlmE/FtsJ